MNKTKKKHKCKRKTMYLNTTNTRMRELFKKLSVTKIVV